MQIARTVNDVRAALPGLGDGLVGLVPTMGALHAGHVALFDAARRQCKRVVASVFVNPTQFGDPADLGAYPRDLERDAEVAAAARVDVLFAPTAEEMYPPGFATWLEPGGAALGLEGAHRPGHFRGVATIVMKLFGIVQPDVAFFGQKDAQQVAVVAQMVADLNVNVRLEVVPTVRDADGVALSSRNARLSPSERQLAAAIPRALESGVAAHRAGGDAVAAARAALQGIEIDYVDVANFASGPTLAVAVRIGGTRLIDNVPLGTRQGSHLR